MEFTALVRSRKEARCVILTQHVCRVVRMKESFFPKYLTPARVVALILVLGVVAVSSSRMIRRPPAYGDFGVYVHAARLMTTGENIYLTPTRPGDLSYIYPPFFAFLFIPVTWIPVGLAIVLWTLLSVVLVGWIVKAFTEVLSGAPFSELPVSTRWTVGTLSVLMTSRYILHHLDRGQANILELALVVAGLKLLERTDNKRAILSGLSLGLSIVVKVITLPLTVWYTARKMRSAIGVAIGVIAGVLAPALYIGWGRNLEFFRFWITNYLLDSSSQNSHLSLGYNFSVLAQLRRFFTREVAVESANRLYYLTIFETPTLWLSLADWLIRFGLLAIVLIFIRRYRTSSALVLQGGAALAIALTPLFFPTAQKNYFVFLLPAHIYVVWLWHRLKLRDRWFVVLTTASFVIGSLTGPELWGQFLSDLFAASGCILWADVLLACAVWRGAGHVNSLLKPS